jgi:hypothetical protein
VQVTRRCLVPLSVTSIKTAMIPFNGVGGTAIGVGSHCGARVIVPIVSSCARRAGASLGGDYDPDTPAIAWPGLANALRGHGRQYETRHVRYGSPTWRTESASASNRPGPGSLYA